MSANILSTNKFSTNHINKNNYVVDDLNPDNSDTDNLGMNNSDVYKLIDAIGMIDDRKIQDARSYTVKSRKKTWGKAASLAAAVLLCFTLSVSALAAAVDPVYQKFYSISPTVAQALKPVKLSCEDQGIRMEVISAAIYENEAAIYISLQDLTGHRIDETTDLFDSYRINRPFASAASCSFVSFDEETETANFLIYISQLDNEKIKGDKITFSFSEFLSQKSKFDGELSGLDLSKLTTAEETQRPESIRGGGGMMSVDYGTDCLVPVAGGILSPLDGVTVTNAGFIDNKLHIQIYFEDILTYDNHGYIDLRDETGNSAENYSISFWDDEKSGSYDEIVYDISPEEIESYQAYGHFVTCKNRTKGNWQVTFPLEDAEYTSK